MLIKRVNVTYVVTIVACTGELLSHKERVPLYIRRIGFIPVIAGSGGLWRVLVGARNKQLEPQRPMIRDIQGNVICNFTCGDHIEAGIRI
jgi:hypothetical protein